MSTRGIIIFAKNNCEDFDYLKFAYLNSLMIKRNLGDSTKVTVITDKKTLESNHGSVKPKYLERGVDNIILLDSKIEEKDNLRIYRNTCYSNKQLPFHNRDRWKAYNLSPYDETILLDADYLIMSDALNKVWGSENEIMLNRSFRNLMISARDNTLEFISDCSVPLYWATVVYFRKSPTSETFFNIVKHVTMNYDFYQHLHGIDSPLFRNDFAFSIAVHMMNGFTLNNPYVSGIAELPTGPLNKMFDTGDIHSVNGMNDITLMLEKPNNLSNFILSRIKEMDVHIMNKWALQNHSDDLIGIYS